MVRIHHLFFRIALAFVALPRVSAAGRLPPSPASRCATASAEFLHTVLDGFLEKAKLGVGFVCEQLKTIHKTGNEARRARMDLMEKSIDDLRDLFGNVTQSLDSQRREVGKRGGPSSNTAVAGKIVNSLGKTLEELFQPVEEAEKLLRRYCASPNEADYQAFQSVTKKANRKFDDYKSGLRASK